MRILFIISLAFITSCGWIEKPAFTKAIILCSGNGGVDKIRKHGFGPVMISCGNGAEFKIPNEKVYTSLRDK